MKETRSWEGGLAPALRRISRIRIVGFESSPITALLRVRPHELIHVSRAARVWPVISNCTARFVFFWIIVALSRAWPPA